MLGPILRDDSRVFNHPDSLLLEMVFATSMTTVRWRPCSQRWNLPITELPTFYNNKTLQKVRYKLQKHLQPETPSRFRKSSMMTPRIFNWLSDIYTPHMLQSRSLAAPLCICFGEFSELKAEFKVPVEFRPENMEFCDLVPWKPSMKLRATSFWKAWILAACGWCPVLYRGCLVCLCFIWCHYYTILTHGYHRISIRKQMCHVNFFLAPHEGSLHWIIKSRMLFLCQPHRIWIGQVRSSMDGWHVFRIWYKSDTGCDFYGNHNFQYYNL